MWPCKVTPALILRAVQLDVYMYSHPSHKNLQNAFIINGGHTLGFSTTLQTNAKEM